MIRYLVATVVLASAIGVCFFAISSENSSESGPNNSNTLDHPIRISANGVPLNSEEEKRFPSPAVFDVDGDGSNELIIGDLMGGVGVYTNLNTSGAGAPVWSARKTLDDSQGNAIITSNW